MSAKSSTPGGHVFIVRGKVQGIACDAWAISCDGRAKPMKENWFPDHISVGSYDWPDPPGGWGYHGVRVARLEHWPDNDCGKEGPQPYLLHVGSHSNEDVKWYAEGTKQF